jgi:hypothetical protein
MPLGAGTLGSTAKLTRQRRQFMRDNAILLLAPVVLGARGLGYIAVRKTRIVSIPLPPPKVRTPLDIHPAKHEPRKGPGKAYSLLVRNGTVDGISPIGLSNPGHAAILLRTGINHSCCLLQPETV